MFEVRNNFKTSSEMFLVRYSCRNNKYEV